MWTDEPVPRSGAARQAFPRPREAPMDIRTPDDAERLVADLADGLTQPSDAECLLCYVIRMLDAFGCDTTLRWAARWRDVRLPSATGLERRLGSRGGYCDCEIFMNGWDLRADLQVRDGDGNQD